MDIRPPDPPLSDGVVTLRSWSLADARAIVAACADAETVRWMHQLPHPYTEADARDYVVGTHAAWRDGTGGTFAVTTAADDRVVGSIGMRVLEPEQGTVEVGYWAAPEARGLGLTTRALRLISAWALGPVGAARVQLRADVGNVPSQRVAEKAGFFREGIQRSGALNAREGRRIDYAVFSLLPDELP